MEWGIAYYRASDGSVPADDFLDDCPTKVEATLLAVLEAVRDAPPPAFSGGGKWEAMHGSMGGYYEIRVTGPGREHFRLFCRLENGTADELNELGFDGPQIVVINGMRKRNATLFTEAEYRKHVRDRVMPTWRASPAASPDDRATGQRRGAAPQEHVESPQYPERSSHGCGVAVTVETRRRGGVAEPLARLCACAHDTRPGSFGNEIR